jgi:hypothetical protein
VGDDEGMVLSKDNMTDFRRSILLLDDVFCATLCFDVTKTSVSFNISFYIAMKVDSDYGKTSNTLIVDVFF